MKKNYKSAPAIMALFLLTACQEDSVSDVQAEKAKNSTPEAEMVKQVESNSTGVPVNGIDSPLEFSLTNLEGEIVKAVDYRGKWLVLNYWATWCAPCRDEMPELVKFQTENEDNVQVVGIAYEDADIQKLKSFAADFNINYPLLTIDVYNPPGFAEEGGLGLPTTIVYTPEGLRYKKHMGPIDAMGLLEMVK